LNEDSIPRVGFVLSGTSTGGAERFLLRVITRLKHDFQPVIFVRGTRKGDLHDQFIDAGAELVYLKLGYLDPVGTYRFMRLLGAYHLRALVDFSGIFSGVTLWAAKLAGIQRRIAFHRRSSFAFEPTWNRSLYAWVSTRLAERVATHILANSQAALEFFHPRLSGNDERLEVIRNFIDPAELIPTRTREAVRNELRIPWNAFVLLHTGRLDPAKDHQTLLAAALGVMDRRASVYCVVAGPGTETLRIEDLTDEPEKGSRFRFLGNRHDVPDLLNAADLFVFPSVTEGQPNALLEAMIVGLPIVTSDILPIREVIPAKYHSHLVHARDAGALSKTILACVEHREEREMRKYLREARTLTDPNRTLTSLSDVLLGGKA
jgi:glycosyltransferase involved in cell wall biosynthesis